MRIYEYSLNPLQLCVHRVTFEGIHLPRESYNAYIVFLNVGFLPCTLSPHFTSVLDYILCQDLYIYVTNHCKNMRVNCGGVNICIHTVHHIIIPYWRAQNNRKIV